MNYHDRRSAGRELAGELVQRGRAGLLEKPVVLALPRGGLPVADEVARELHAPLDVVVVRKIGAPFNPEFAVGAVAGEDEPWYDGQTLEMLELTPERLAPASRRNAGRSGAASTSTARAAPRRTWPAARRSSSTTGSPRAAPRGSRSAPYAAGARRGWSSPCRSARRRRSPR